MNAHMLPKDAVAEWIELLAGEYRIVGPMRKQEVIPRPAEGSVPPSPRRQYYYDEVRQAADLELTFPNTILPPKKFFLPQKEELFSFSANGRRLDLHLDERRTVIFGIHTCDLRAIQLVDRAFGQGLADQHYQFRRANTALVSVECLQPCSENSFCRDMGAWTAPEEFDLHLTDLGDEYHVSVGSARGAELLQSAPGIRPASEADLDRYDQVLSAKWPRFPYRLEVEQSELPGLLGAGYTSPVWEEIGRRCLSCGGCTMVCPTCTCFDVTDEVEFDLSSGRRYRVWDSCQFGQFATVAGGHDFRNSRAARLRHRFSHKYKYQTESTGMAGCVGCGRCADTCLVHITPVEVLNKLHRKRAAAAGKHREVKG